MASIKDVAKRAGVSIATVSRYMNRTAFVDEEKAAAIKAAMEELHYAPSQFGRGLVKQENNLIGIYFYQPEGSVFDNSYSLELLKGIEKGIRDTNYSMVLLSESKALGDSGPELPKYIEYVRQKRLDGLILSGLSTKVMREQAFREIVEQGFPMVYIGKRIHEKGLNVYAQFEKYNVQMIRTLYQNGHRKVVYFIYEGHEYMLQSILDTVKADMPDLVLEPILFSPLELGRTVASAVISFFKENEYTACVCPGKETVLALTAAAVQEGLRIPDDISVISVESAEGELQGFKPAISVFQTQTRRMGEGAVKQLIKAIRHEKIARSSLEFETAYIERDSIRRIK